MFAMSYRSIIWYSRSSSTREMDCDLHFPTWGFLEAPWFCAEQQHVTAKESQTWQGQPVPVCWIQLLQHSMFLETVTDQVFTLKDPLSTFHSQCKQYHSSVLSESNTKYMCIWTNCQGAVNSRDLNFCFKKQRKRKISRLPLIPLPFLSPGINKDDAW